MVPGAYDEFGPLAKHLRFVERRSRKVARQTFYAMGRWQAKMEYKQAFLGRDRRHRRRAVRHGRLLLARGDDPQAGSGARQGRLRAGRGVLRAVAPPDRGGVRPAVDQLRRRVRPRPRGRYTWLGPASSTVRGHRPGSHWDRRRRSTSTVREAPAARGSATPGEPGASRRSTGRPPRSYSARRAAAPPSTCVRRAPDAPSIGLRERQVATLGQSRRDPASARDRPADRA